MTIDDLLPGWLTTHQAQELTGYSTRQLYRLARRGVVYVRRVGPQWIFNQESLQAHQATAKPGPKPGKERKA